MTVEEHKQLIDKVQIALESIRPFLQRDGGDVELVDVSQDFFDHSKLLELLNSSEPSNIPNFFIGPRSGTISPWASKTSEIIANVGIQGVKRIEKYVGYFLENNKA